MRSNVKKNVYEKMNDLRTEYVKYEKIILLLNLHKIKFKNKFDEEHKNILDEISSKLKRKVDILIRDLKKIEEMINLY